MKPSPRIRVVFDTNTVISALLFPNGRLAWLRKRWHEDECEPLISAASTSELMRVLAYPKFRLSLDDRLELLADYLPNCETVEVNSRCEAVCRDPKDQQFLDLAVSGRADVLVSGDEDLLSLAGQTGFQIKSPEAYRSEILGPK